MKRKGQKRQDIFKYMRGGLENSSQNKAMRVIRHWEWYPVNPLPHLNTHICAVSAHRDTFTSDMSLPFPSVHYEYWISLSKGRIVESVWLERQPGACFQSPETLMPNTPLGRSSIPFWCWDRGKCLQEMRRFFEAETLWPKDSLSWSHRRHRW